MADTAVLQHILIQCTVADSAILQNMGEKCTVADTAVLQHMGIQCAVVFLFVEKQSAISFNVRVSGQVTTIARTQNPCNIVYFMTGCIISNRFGLAAP